MLDFIWYIIVVLLVTGYAILDGFDLGVGMLHLFSNKDEERRLMLNSIGPVWDGNEVWLVCAGGALFAGFPGAYATIASGFYEAVMLFLAGIILRAVAIEFRSKQPMEWWRWTWDVFFSVASGLIAFGLGVVLGNLIHGIPLDAKGDFTGNFISFLNPYALMMGITSVALFCMHGSIYIVMKTEGALHNKMRARINPSIIFFIICYVSATMATLIYEPHMAEIVKNHPELFFLALATMLFIANIPREIHKGRDGMAFVSSCLTILCLMALFAIGTYPNLVRASNDPEHLSITVQNAASSVKTLKILLTITAIGIPLVLSYTFGVYYFFHGKVKLDSTSY